MTSQLQPTDWYEWAGIKATSRESLIQEANSMKVPIFESDSDEQIYSRLYNSKVLTANRKTVILNIILCAISFIAAAASVVQLFPKR